MKNSLRIRRVSRPERLQGRFIQNFFNVFFITTGAIFVGVFGKALLTGPKEETIAVVIFSLGILLGFVLLLGVTKPVFFGRS